MKQHDVFIEKYKELEKLLTVSVREYEDTLSEEDAQKMRICRLLRNYIQHNADYEKVISIAPGLQAYLDSVVDNLHKQNGILKEHMVSAAKYGFVSETDAVADAAAIMNKKKRKSNIVLNKNGEYLGILTKEIVSDCFGELNITKTTKISKIAALLLVPEVTKINQSTSMDVINDLIEKDNSIILVVNNSNKIVGVFNTDK